ncbi:MAG: DUF488 family protein [Parcubacteria group bacterium]|jgi:uncharacterized protein YeaO (DUF488 family)
MLQTNCILLPPINSDGLRISVMSRHTLSDGITPDERILPDSYDLWLKDLAPPDWLVGKYYRGEISFADYSDSYLTHLRQDLQVAILKVIARYGLRKKVMLLCIERSPVMCHRTILLHECCRHEPELRIQNF